MPAGEPRTTAIVSTTLQLQGLLLFQRMFGIELKCPQDREGKSPSVDQSSVLPSNPILAPLRSIIRGIHSTMWSNVVVDTTVDGLDCLDMDCVQDMARRWGRSTCDQQPLSHVHVLWLFIHSAVSLALCDQIPAYVRELKIPQRPSAIAQIQAEEELVLMAAIQERKENKRLQSTS